MFRDRNLRVSEGTAQASGGVLFLRHTHTHCLCFFFRARSSVSAHLLFTFFCLLNTFPMILCIVYCPTARRWIFSINVFRYVWHISSWSLMLHSCICAFPRSSHTAECIQTGSPPKPREKQEYKSPNYCYRERCRWVREDGLRRLFTSEAAALTQIGHADLTSVRTQSSASQPGLGGLSVRCGGS